MMHLQSLLAFIGHYLMLVLPITMLAMVIYIATYLVVYKVCSYRLFQQASCKKIVVLLVLYGFIYLAGYIVQLRDISLVDIDIIRGQQGFVMLSMLCMSPYLCHIILKYLDSKYSRFRHQLKS